MVDVNKRRRISFSLSKLECGPQEINSREIRLHLPFSANWNKRDKDWKNGNSFSLPLPSSMLKLPNEYDGCGKGIICWLITLVVRVFSNYRVQLKIIAKLWLTNHVIWRGEWDAWISPEISFRNSWLASSQVTLPVTSSLQPRILLAGVGSSSCKSYPWHRKNSAARNKIHFVFTVSVCS